MNYYLQDVDYCKQQIKESNKHIAELTEQRKNFQLKYDEAKVRIYEYFRKMNLRMNKAN